MKHFPAIDSITLGAGHSMLTGFKPDVVKSEDLEQIFKAHSFKKDSIESFGLFSSDIDYNTYYPDVTADQLQPKEEEFIKPIFRMLSEVIVNKQWNPVDFGKPGVLKESMGLLTGQTVNCDHETNIGNAIGSVSSVFWQDSYKLNGVVIPAGINAELMIDGKSNPRIARGIMMTPPSIHSNSVTVRFTWEKSHPNISDDEFWNKLGTYDKEGSLIRRVANKIIQFQETSLVSHGADPFAQKIDENGNIINPMYADATYSFKAEEARKLYTFMDYKDINKEDTLHNTNKSYNENNSNPLNKNVMTLEQFLQSLFGDGLLSLADGQETTSDLVIAKVREVVSANADALSKLSQAQTDLTTKSNELEQLKQENTQNLEFITLGKAHVESLRTGTLESYKKLMGDKLDDSMVKLIEEAPEKTLATLSSTYAVQLEEKFPMSCSACGSHEVSRASSAKENEDEINNSSSDNGDIVSKLRKEKLQGESK